MWSPKMFRGKTKYLPVEEKTDGVLRRDEGDSVWGAVGDVDVHDDRTLVDGKDGRTALVV